MQSIMWVITTGPVEPVLYCTEAGRLIWSYQGTAKGSYHCNLIHKFDKGMSLNYILQTSLA